MKLKKPSELFEQKRLEALAKESVQDQKQLNKRIVSPKELFGEVVENVVEELVEEKIEEPIDPYIQEINLLKLQLEDLSNLIPEETDLTEVFETIESLKIRIDNLPKQKSYRKEIESIKEELVRIENNIPVVEKFDPSDLYENIGFIKTKLEEVRSAIPVVPEPILYDNELNELKELIESVRKNIPVIPKIKYYDEELQGILDLIDDVKNQILELPEIKYYDDEISVIENRLIEIQNSIPVVPEVKYYDEDVEELKEEIASIKASIPVVPEVKYYDEDVKELKEEIASVKASIPEVKYYDEDVKELKERITLVKESIPVVPEVKYYDEDVKELQEEIASVKASIPVVPEVKYYDKEVKDLYKKVSAIKIPDQGKYLKEVKEIYETFEKKNHKLLEKVKYLEEVFEKFNEETLTEGLLNEPPDVKNSDPLTPLDQNFVTLSQLQDHYRLFINRIQQQLASIGGGGETRLEFLDDVDKNSAKVDGRFLKYDAASKKWIGALSGGGGSQTLDDTLGLGNTSSLGMSVGLTTVTRLIVDPVGSGTTFTENLVVEGSARITGILSIGTGTITLDPEDNAIVLADVKIRRDHSTGDVRFLDTRGNLSNIVANAVTVGSGDSSVSLIANNGAIVFANNSGEVVADAGITSTTSINTTGIITANSYYAGSTQVINSAGQWVGSGLSVYSNIDGGVPNSVYGGIPVIDGGVP